MINKKIRSKYAEIIDEVYSVLPKYKKESQYVKRKIFSFVHIGVYNYRTTTPEKQKQLLRFLYNKLKYGNCCDQHNKFSKQMETERRKRPAAYVKLRQLIVSGKAKCGQCGSTKNLTIDHILPIAKGGKTEGPNLQILCEKCNTAKGDALWPGLKQIPFEIT
jgi:5-methylcytosine-specific restriction endonuclease McrA